MLRGKTAIITGSAKGIGRAILKIFAENGADIYAHARAETPEFLSEIEQLSESHNVKITPFCFDLNDYDSMKVKIKDLFSSKQTIDILVNNAGIIGDPSSFLMTSIEKMKSLFEINFFAQMALTQYIVRIMMKKGGNIINISSITAIDGENQLDYSSSKAALIGATRRLARELASYKIRVNAIAPGIIETDMSDKISLEFKEKVISNTFMKRTGNTQEIAGPVLFLASDLSSFITGQVLRVDGGM